MSDRRARWIFAVVLVATACSADSPSQPPSALTATPPQRFTDVAAQAGLADALAAPPTEPHLLASEGSGITVGDYDGDGDEDLYLPCPGATNQLYRNNGDGSFSEVAVAAGVAVNGWTNAAYFVDYDNDGDQDLFLANWGANQLFGNLGNGRFSDISQAAGIRGGANDWTTAAAFGDLDQDGFLDLFVVNYGDYEPPDPPDSGVETLAEPPGLVRQSDHLYRNNGDATFSEISQLAGLAAAAHLFGSGLAMLDLDRDEDLDVFVGNVASVNQLWLNNGAMPFVEIGAWSSTATNVSASEGAGRGVDVADVDEDGFVDLFVSAPAHEWSTLYINAGGMRFHDGTFEAGLADTWKPMGWGVKFFDFDNDGWLDLALANGHLSASAAAQAQRHTEFRQPDQLLHNRGDGTFETLSDAAWNAAASSRGLAVFDYDGDGDIDVVVTHVDAAPSLLRNDVGNSNNWISIRLAGSQSNRDGIGAWMELEVGGRKFSRQVNPFGSYRSQSSMAVHFGVGEAAFIDRLTVHWPSERTFAYEDLRTNRFYTILEGSGIVDVREPTEARP